MKFIVVTYGTEGDARPFAALCRGLMDAGHETRLLADAATLGSAQRLGVPTNPLAGDIRATLRRDLAISEVVAKGGGFNETARALAKIANENTESWLRTIIEAGEGCDAVVAAGLAAFAGFSAAEYLGAKAIGSGMIPITPTAAFPSPFLPSRWVPRVLNRASHRFVNGMLWKAFREKTNSARDFPTAATQNGVGGTADALWRLTQPVARAYRLASRCAPVRTVVSAGHRLDAATRAGRLPGRR